MLEKDNEDWSTIKTSFLRHFDAPASDCDYSTTCSSVPRTWQGLSDVALIRVKRKFYISLGPTKLFPKILIPARKEIKLEILPII